MLSGSVRLEFRDLGLEVLLIQQQVISSLQYCEFHEKMESVGDLRGKDRRRAWQSVRWSTYFDVFAKQVGIETQPVPGDVESPLQ